MPVDKQIEIIKRGTVEILKEDELKERLEKKKVLTVKAGFDPTAPDIHLGHTVLIRKLRQFQDLGHKVVFLIGDYTGMIGDPTGKNATRKQLTKEEVLQNAQTYKDQVEKILDMDKLTIEFNSKWFKDMNFEEVIKLSSKYTLARMLERDDFEKRYSSQQPISIHEFFYPLMQGYDSVALESDIELGGTDQKFNLVMGRHLQREYGQSSQIIMTMPLLEGLDGVEKMSKSLGNYIGINESPNEMFGKIMSLNDEIMYKYFELLTDIDMEEIKKMKTAQENGENPMIFKKRLAKEIITFYHSEEDAAAAQAHFEKVHSRGEIPDEMDEFKTTEGKWFLPKLICETGLAGSNSEARRHIKGGAVKINQEKVSDPRTEIELEKGETVLQVGKRKFIKIIY
ncbi:MAG: tyrosine--tRNA ligase [Candidatus Muiribacterium halophilum]|uniref:Tyrosine--tRNA ligase n=1 Tax=Muiribacterium halophilum TaxID=2053465 RepID=A0A2N5ZME4_MUIH1|nr:MAG: tyrosine--tRNA ligase [Candidatus Muirbacterium halophilum]